MLLSHYHPLQETKTQTMCFPEAVLAYCYGSHIRIEREAILGSLPQAGSSQWNQPFSAQHCLTTEGPTCILLPEFSPQALSRSLLSCRDSNQSYLSVHLQRAAREGRNPQDAIQDDKLCSRSVSPEFNLRCI